MSNVKLITISTGSKGNCYALCVGEEILILDCGVKVSGINKAIDYKIQNVVGALVSHNHKDHDAFSSKLAEYGVRVYRPHAGDKVDAQIGGFKVKEFPVEHDGVPCFGFFIYHPDMGKLVYLTDLEYCQYKFEGLDYIVVECNYDENLIDESRHNYVHQVRGHMSLKTCCDFVACNAHEKCRKVVLIHPSDYVLDKQKALEEVGKIFSNTEFAEKGKVIELSG